MRETITAPHRNTDAGEEIPCAVRLKLPDSTRIHPVFNVSLLIHYKDPVSDPQAIRLPQPIDRLESAPRFEVQALVGHKWVKCGKRKRLILKVDWVGVCDDTWEPRSNLFEAIKSTLLEYEALHADLIASDKIACASPAPAIVQQDTEMVESVAEFAETEPGEITSGLPLPPPVHPVAEPTKRVRKKNPRYLQSCYMFE